MSKAILVIDMPTDCEDCPLFKDGDKGMRKCEASRKGTEWDYYKVRPDWCPLRELPQKQTVHSIDTAHHRFAKDGWNACLNEILGE